MNHLPIPEDVESSGKKLLDAAYRVHTVLGPGLLESVYEKCLATELARRGVPHACQSALPISYDGVTIKEGMRLDLLVEGRVIAELKAVQDMLPLFDAQLITYLKLSGLRLGFLINFNVPHLRDGIKRLVV
ncbi:MAG: GxxExxY protein [Planctomycetota bacterium]